MLKTTEIYLAEKHIAKEKWYEFINTISNYNGYFRSWKLIIKIEDNQIRYFVKTRCTLPTTINNLESFLLKNVDDVEVPSGYISLPYILQLGSNIVDIINNFEIKNKGNLEVVEITFRKIQSDKYFSKTNLFVRKNDNIRKYHLLFDLPNMLLSVNFEGNKRYFYKEAPKYLDINKSLHLLNTDALSSILKIDTFPYLQGDFYLKQNSYNFDKHSIVFGASGCGKSKFIN